MNKKHYTQDELNEMRRLKAEGKTFIEIGNMYSRSAKALSLKFAQLGWSGRFYGVQKWDDQEEVKEPEPEKPKVTLNDFRPRDMIKHLYKLGYRIENNQLVCYVKQAVNVKDIIEN